MQEKKRYFTCSPGFMLSASMSLSKSVSGRPSENAPHSVLIICSYNFESIQFDDIYSPIWKNDFFIHKAARKWQHTVFPVTGPRCRSFGIKSFFSM
jgi:hypothetical protein